MCPRTISNMLSRAKYPQRLRFAIVEQNASSDVPCDSPATPCNDDPLQFMCVHEKQIDIVRVPYESATGPVTARAIGSRMYAGEAFALQIDSHLEFIREWDVAVLEQHSSTGNLAAVLTTYLSNMNSGAVGPDGENLQHTTPVMAHSGFVSTHGVDYLSHGATGAQTDHFNSGMPFLPLLSPYWAAGWSFSPGKFVVDVPNDPYLPMVFNGEEISMGLRGWSHGYDYYSPTAVAYHFYESGENKEMRKEVPHFWENQRAHAGSDLKSYKRLVGLLKMAPELRPGIDYDDREEAGHATGWGA